jgi:hypothetical protein
MQLVDWETLDRIPDAPASATLGGQVKKKPQANKGATAQVLGVGLTSAMVLVPRMLCFQRTSGATSNTLQSEMALGSRICPTFDLATSESSSRNPA